MINIGKYGEYLVLANLLERDIEAYQAINVNQPDFDITVILNKNSVIRLQVKSTELNNKATNNAISGIEKDYDILIVVIFLGNGKSRFFIMSKKEAMDIKGNNKLFGVSQKENGKAVVKKALLKHEDCWDIISA